MPTNLHNNYRTIIQLCTVQQIEVFNILPYRLQKVKSVKTDMIKKHLDDGLEIYPIVIR